MNFASKRAAMVQRRRLYLGGILVKYVAFGAVMACALSSVVAAQPAASSSAPTAVHPVIVPAPTIVATPPQSYQTSVPANTELVLSMNDELTTKGGKIEVGTKFRLSLVNDIKLNGYVVIPRGTPAMGEVTYKTGKGMFGKSGKMEIDLRHLDLNGQIIPITGHYRQEGSGNTVATIATVVLVAPIAGMLVTGRSATLPQGRELKAYLADALPVTVPVAAAAPSVTALPIPATAMPVASTINAAAPAAGSR
jgi:hypothetical protein